MTKKVEFYYDFGSPTAYMAWTQLPKIASNANAKLIYVPILLGGVFKATGNASPAFIPAKGKYMGNDLKRYAKKYAIQYKHNSFFPINTLNLMRGAIAAESLGLNEKYMETIRNEFNGKKPMRNMETIYCTKVVSSTIIHDSFSCFL